MKSLRGCLLLAWCLLFVNTSALASGDINAISLAKASLVRGDKGGYAREMDDSLRVKIDAFQAYLTDILLLNQPVTVLDIGCGTGSLAIWLAKNLPAGSNVIAIDLDAEMLEIGKNNARALKIDNIDFRKENVACHQDLNIMVEQCLSVPVESVDVIIFSSILHEIYSYGESNPVRVLSSLLTAKYILKKGGKVWIRDFIRPETNQDIILKHLKTDITFPVTEFVDQFSELHPESNFFALEAETPDEDNPYRIFLTDLVTAYDFIFRKDYHDNWDAELFERYGFWTYKEARIMALDSGFHIRDSRTYKNPWITRHRLLKKILLLDPLSLEPLEFPAYQIIMELEKPARLSNIPEDKILPEFQERKSRG